jgi:hypothetical protein
MMTLRDHGSIDYDFYRARARELRTAALNRSMRAAWQFCRAALTVRKGPTMRASRTGCHAEASSFISPNYPAA